GRERSRNSAEILKEIKGLIDAGYKDITLLGQNVNSYKGDMDFPELLDAAASFDGEYRIRFMTSHPKDASEKLIEVMKNHPETIARHFHLPAQSGNDRILKAMNRKYTRENYLETVKKIRAAMPDIAITTDIICGFPTETDEEFEDTVSLIKEVGYDMIYTFIYSPRPGTVAAKMEGHIPHDEQVRRFKKLSAAQDEISAEKSKSYMGKTVKVLSDGNFEARNSQNKIVTLDKDVPAGQFVTVEITETKAYGLKGKVIN
ncbi:MAG: MiaB/RimO family radical SAM methylthiotransferase, partial [Clostridia bacterium]|nr:MiaB/RimO family radical SAM methylthiotransferase [Clostridia bacterium]